MKLEHEKAARSSPDWLIQVVVDDVGSRKLTDYRDHETRWCAERVKAFRAERRRRKALKVWGKTLEMGRVAA